MAKTNRGSWRLSHIRESSGDLVADRIGSIAKDGEEITLDDVTQIVKEEADARTLTRAHAKLNMYLALMLLVSVIANCGFTFYAIDESKDTQITGNALTDRDSGRVLATRSYDFTTESAAQNGRRLTNTEQDDNPGQLWVDACPFERTKLNDKRGGAGRRLDELDPLANKAHKGFSRRVVVSSNLVGEAELVGRRLDGDGESGLVWGEEDTDDGRTTETKVTEAEAEAAMKTNLGLPLENTREVMTHQITAMRRRRLSDPNEMGVLTVTSKRGHANKATFVKGLGIAEDGSANRRLRELRDARHKDGDAEGEMTEDACRDYCKSLDGQKGQIYGNAEDGTADRRLDGEDGKPTEYEMSAKYIQSTAPIDGIQGCAAKVKKEEVVDVVGNAEAGTANRLLSQTKKVKKIEVEVHWSTAPKLSAELFGDRRLDADDRPKVAQPEGAVQVRLRDGERKADPPGAPENCRIDICHNAEFDAGRRLNVVEQRQRTKRLLEDRNRVTDLGSAEYNGDRRLASRRTSRPEVTAQLEKSVADKTTGLTTPLQPGEGSSY